MIMYVTRRHYYFSNPFLLLSPRHRNACCFEPHYTVCVVVDHLCSLMTLKWSGACLVSRPVNAELAELMQWSGSGTSRNKIHPAVISWHQIYFLSPCLWCHHLLSVLSSDKTKRVIVIFFPLCRVTKTGLITTKPVVHLRVINNLSTCGKSYQIKPRYARCY